MLAGAGDFGSKNHATGRGSVVVEIEEKELRQEGEKTLP